MYNQGDPCAVGSLAASARHCSGAEGCTRVVTCAEGCTWVVTCGVPPEGGIRMQWVLLGFLFSFVRVTYLKEHQRERERSICWFTP